MILEVVAHVLLAQPLSQLGPRGVMVHVVVRVVVEQVSEDESSEDRVGAGRAEDQRVDPEEEGGERHADRRRHHEPQAVVGMVVVNSVDDEVQTAPDRVVGLPVEDEPVEPVLGQGPDHEPERDQQAEADRAVTAVGGQPDGRYDDRHEDDRRDRRVNPREEVEEAVLKQGRRRAQSGCPPLGCHRRRL